MRRRFRFPAMGWVTAGMLLWSSGCLGFSPLPEETLSLGENHRGALHRGYALPEQGPGFLRARPGEETRFGSIEMVHSLMRAAAAVDRHFPNTAPLKIGDLSSPRGGFHLRHRSHRNGRDADLLFYATDVAGRSEPASGFLHFNRFGYALQGREQNPPTSGRIVLFDDARNWYLVRQLLMDEEAAIQWIFVSQGLKARLLRYAVEHESDPEALLRAAYVLHQPVNALPHDDHFHLRVLCTARQQAAGCRHRGPIWPWLREVHEGPATPVGDTLDDNALAAEIIESLQ